MSASLVGSEMCIRDSRCSAGPLANVDAWRLLILKPRVTHVTCPRTPVSYTHLTLPTICSV
eukprot:10545648-Alexandrium_andersonii.AAC.1